MNVQLYLCLLVFHIYIPDSYYSKGYAVLVLSIVQYSVLQYNVQLYYLGILPNLQDKRGYTVGTIRTIVPGSVLQ